MRIGIDLDGVVYDTIENYRVYSELYDELVLKRDSRKDSREMMEQKRMNWTDEEFVDFFSRCHEKIVRESNLMPGCKEVLELLKKDGHELIVVTARGAATEEVDQITGFSSDTVTVELMKKDGIYDLFTKCCFREGDKKKVCLEEKIDVMIDDLYSNCLDIASANIDTIYFENIQSFDLTGKENITTLYNWGEVYRYIREKSMNKA